MLSVKWLGICHRDSWTLNFHHALLSPRETLVRLWSCVSLSSFIKVTFLVTTPRVEALVLLPAQPAQIPNVKI